jgi:hypothetical protein
VLLDYRDPRKRKSSLREVAAPDGEAATILADGRPGPTTPRGKAARADHA